VKTTKDMKVRRENYNQLIGYYVLAMIDRVDGLPRGHPITKLGIYFSRFGELYTIATDEVADVKTFRSFARWFRHRAQEHTLIFEPLPPNFT
jgi:hypothetical protein